MSFGLSGAALAGIAVGGATLVGNYMSAEAAGDAAASQQQTGYAGIAEQQRQFDAIQKLLSPYVNAGTQALGGQQDLLGLNGAGAQQGAISAIQQSPAYTALMQSGQNAILQNASATGGLRGGNVQAALAKFSPAVLAQLIQQQYGNLGSMAGLGQNAAAGTGNAMSSTSNNITSLLQQIGSAQAGSDLASGKAYSNIGSALSGAFGTYTGLGGKF